MRYKVPDTLKYFCLSEAVAYYLQKYVVYRKRKIYVGKRTFADLAPLIKKYKNEKFLLPSSDMLKPEVPRTLNKLGVEWKKRFLPNRGKRPFPPERCDLRHPGIL